MAIIVDTSIVIACVLDEPPRAALLAATVGHDLLAPATLPFEIANAFSRLFKRQQLLIQEATAAYSLYEQMQIDLRPVDMVATIRLSERLQLYAYDAAVLQCAVESGHPLLTLDRGLRTAARGAKVITL